jgi:SAM-dependent methyltransferase
MTPTAATIAALRWAETPRGHRLVALEQKEVRRLLPDLFGRHFVQIGNWGSAGADWLSATAMLHRTVLALNGAEAGDARADSQRLPLAAKSVDAVLLPHTLEHVSSPHGLLREVARVLNDRGRLVLLGFNPHSALGWRRALGMGPRHLPSQGVYYSSRRISDWLHLLDFEVTELRRFSVGFPWVAVRSEAVPFAPAALLASLGEAYCIAAKKRVLPLSLVGKLSKQQLQIMVPVAAAVARQAANDGRPDHSLATTRNPWMA